MWPRGRRPAVETLGGSLFRPAVAAALAVALSSTLVAQPFPPLLTKDQAESLPTSLRVEAATLETGLLRIDGLGDVNGDGFDDFVVGDTEIEYPGFRETGAAFVVFGRPAPWPNPIDLGELDGSNGWVASLDQDYRQAGHSVSAAGDFNGDGFADLLIGSSHQFTPDFAGVAFLVYGGPTVGASGLVELADLDGADGFKISGFELNDRVGRDLAGVGDFNGDGIDDILIGAPGRADLRGSAYLVFGGTEVPGGQLRLDSLDPEDGFEIVGIETGDELGEVLGVAGDLNHDGFADLAIGAYRVPGPGFSPKGQTYIVFGGPDVGASGRFEVSELDGSNGFFIEVSDASTFSPSSLSAGGDFNGDGIDDLLFGQNDTANSRTYVLFGDPALGAAGTIEIEALAAGAGVELIGIPNSGDKVDGVGDFNGDGIDDVLIGTNFTGFSTDPFDAGVAYLVYGGPHWDAVAAYDLTEIDSAVGLQLVGSLENDGIARTVAGAGDLDGDGLDDALITFEEEYAGGNPGVMSLAGRTTPPPLTLTLSPLVAGESTSATISGATPGAAVALGASPTGYGLTPLPALGIVLALDAPVAVLTLTADASGQASGEFTVPLESAGEEISLQAATDANLSAVTRAVVERP